MTAPKKIIAHTRITVTSKKGEQRVADAGDVLTIGTDVTDEEAKAHLAAHAAASHVDAAPAD